jgi:hypothetical protein
MAMGALVWPIMTGRGNTTRDHLVCVLSPPGFTFPVTQSLSVDEKYHDDELIMLTQHFTDQRPDSSLYSWTPIEALILKVFCNVGVSSTLAERILLAFVVPRIIIVSI